MLHQQTRPKSQPPMVQFVGDSSRNNNNNSSNQTNANGSEEFKLEKSVSDLSLSSSASSSSLSGSLASSSLSISTDSSTSTVLAALNKHQQSIGQHQLARPKSMIARFNPAQPSAGQQTQELPANIHRRSLQHPISTSSSTSEDDDGNDSIKSANQLSSSSSSTSSASDSSGLSSMNSSSGPNNFVGAVGASELALEREVGECLDDLVGSIAASVVEVPEVVQRGNESLHQAVLMQTRSSTTTSGSSDEDNVIEKCRSSVSSYKYLSQSRANPMRMRLKFVEEFDIEPALIEDSYMIFHLARQNLSDSIEGSDRKLSSRFWLACINEHELAIEWKRNDQVAVNRVYFTQVLECFVDQHLIVWILDRCNPSPSELGASSNQLLVVDAQQQQHQQQQQLQHNESARELETTLDDIALALDEPIGRRAELKVEPQTQHGNNGNVVAMVWLCSSELEAAQVSDAYKSLRFNMVVGAKEEIVQRMQGDANNWRDEEDKPSASVACLDRREQRQHQQQQQQTKYLQTHDDDDETEMANKEDQLAALRRRLRQSSDKSSGGAACCGPVQSGGRPIGITNGLVSDNTNRQQVNSNRRSSSDAESERRNLESVEEKLMQAKVALNHRAEPSGKLTTTTATKGAKRQSASATSGSGNKWDGELEVAKSELATTCDSSSGCCLVSKAKVAKTTTIRRDDSLSTCLANNELAPEREVVVEAEAKAVAGACCSLAENLDPFFGSKPIEAAKSGKDETNHATAKPNESNSAAAAAAGTTTKPIGARLVAASQDKPSKASSKSQLKKSLSGLNLSRTSSSNSGTFSLAAYYRNVASRMLSTSSSKIKSLKDEMIKLNNQMPSATATSAAQPAPNTTNLSKATSQLDSKAAGKRLSGANLIGSTVGRSHLAPCSSCDAASASSPSVSHRSAPPDESAKSAASPTYRPKVDQAPTVKPRTSILKNKQHSGADCHNKGCDIDSNNNNRRSSVSYSQGSTELATNKQPTLASYKRNSTVGAANLVGQSRNDANSSSRPTKSILKNTKPTSNISSGDKTLKPLKDSLRNHENTPSYTSLHEKQPAPSSSFSMENNDTKKIDQTATLRRNTAKDYEGSSRRWSTYSLVNESKLIPVQGDDVEPTQIDNQIEHEREQAFERLRQRASCYDITRLMSKNGLHNQLGKLRAGSTASVAGAKSRQRRPALLLDETQQTVDAVNENDLIARENAEKAPAIGKPFKISADQNMQKTYSDPDGTVRAKVSAAQLKSSVVDIDWSSGIDQSAGDKVVLGKEKKAIALRQQREPSTIMEKQKPGDRCEFDPRSLRRNSVIAQSSPTSSSSSSSISSSTGETTSRRKSMTSVELLNMKRKEQESVVVEVQQAKVGGQPKPLKTILKQRCPPKVESANKRQLADSVVASSGSSNDEADDDTEKGESDDDDDDGDETETPSCDESEVERKLSDKRSKQEHKDEANVPIKASKSTSSLNKNGPFNLLRQSFNQKTLSSMLKFSSRASLRVKSSATSGQGTIVSEAPMDKSADKVSKCAQVEADLAAIKQIKQQKRREQQQQQQQMLLHQHQQLQQHHHLPITDPATSMMLAVQYNQQQQYQRQQQQQQMLYAQQYASVHMQHQLLVQRHQHQQQQQQQHQMANYMASYMAQQMAVAAPPPLVPMGAIAQPPTGQQLMYLQPAPMVGAQPPLQPAPPSSASIFRKSMMRSKQQQQQQQAAMYAAAVGGGQQLIPMSVNHHSSFNIVYAGPSDSGNGHQFGQQIAAAESQPVARQQAPASSMTKSSLGASMRKTVKSILTNRSPFATTSNTNNANSVSSDKAASDQSNKVGGGENHQLKSALKSSASSRKLVLNSEGSDGDGSSSDSTVTNGTEAPAKLDRHHHHNHHHHHHTHVKPDSALKKTSSATSSSSSDASRCSSLSRNIAHRQSVRACDSDIRASKRKVAASSGRKNVTFSTKLTSIL